MKMFPVLAALALCAALPVSAGDDQALPNPNELNSRNCMRVMAPLTATEINAPDYREKALFRSACVDWLIAQRRNRQEQELLNRSTDAALVNCVRMFFSIAADGTEYHLRPEYRKCGRSPNCIANLTLLATDGIQNAEEKTTGSLINVAVHDTGRWLSLNKGGFLARCRNNAPTICVSRSSALPVTGASRSLLQPCDGQRLLCF